MLFEKLQKRMQQKNILTTCNRMARFRQKTPMQENNSLKVPQMSNKHWC